MSIEKFSNDELYSAVFRCGGIVSKAAAKLGVRSSSLHRRLTKAGLMDSIKAERKRVISSQKKSAGQNYSEDEFGDPNRSEASIIKTAGLNPEEYVVEGSTVNLWEVSGKDEDSNIWSKENKQVKLNLRKKSPDASSFSELIEELKANSVKVKRLKKPKLPPNKNERVLEVSLSDLHFGLNLHKEECGSEWNMEKCSEMVLDSLEAILERAKAFGPFSQIVFPVGNDIVHCDNLFGTTTKGTPQPDSVSLYASYPRLVQLVSTVAERLSEVAPVHIIHVAGNHDKLTSYNLCMLLAAKYANNENVTVDVGSSAYKFYSFGDNLIGFNHGNYIKPDKLVSLMANSRPEDWATSKFREWHLGHHHRKGVSRPIMWEESGVSVEYLPTLVPSNDWHNERGYCFNQRGAVGFVWDAKGGCVAKLQVNVNLGSGELVL